MRHFFCLAVDDWGGVGLVFVGDELEKLCNIIAVGGRGVDDCEYLSRVTCVVG